MSENEEFETAREEKRHTSTPNPALEGEGGQYVDGDYGDAGVLNESTTAPGEGEYPEGDYGDAGKVDPSGLTQRQRNAAGDDAVPGRADDDTDGRIQRD
jgi:hypothetical protein